MSREFTQGGTINITYPYMFYTVNILADMLPVITCDFDATVKLNAKSATITTRSDILLIAEDLKTRIKEYTTAHHIPSECIPSIKVTLIIL